MSCAYQRSPLYISGLPSPHQCPRAAQRAPQPPRHAEAGVVCQEHGRPPHGAGHGARTHCTAIPGPPARRAPLLPAGGHHPLRGSAAPRRGLHRNRIEPTGQPGVGFFQQNGSEDSGQPEDPSGGRCRPDPAPERADLSHRSPSRLYAIRHRPGHRAGRRRLRLRDRPDGQAAHHVTQRPHPAHHRRRTAGRPLLCARQGHTEAARRAQVRIRAQGGGGGGGEEAKGGEGVEEEAEEAEALRHFRNLNNIYQYLFICLCVRRRSGSSSITLRRDRAGGIQG
mmetsp:Transcript_12274/g.27482  ORF Transcript_12274/g.27482 Transcript_12274/m.27482 type:complete len:281 (+) Transcript_12274:688-1530(+)